MRVTPACVEFNLQVRWCAASKRNTCGNASSWVPTPRTCFSTPSSTSTPSTSCLRRRRITWSCPLPTSSSTGKRGSLAKGGNPHAVSHCATTVSAQQRKVRGARGKNPYPPLPSPPNCCATSKCPCWWKCFIIALVRGAKKSQGGKNTAPPPPPTHRHTHTLSYFKMSVLIVSSLLPKLEVQRKDGGGRGGRGAWEI